MFFSTSLPARPPPTAPSTVRAVLPLPPPSWWPTTPPATAPPTAPTPLALPLRVSVWALDTTPQPSHRLDKVTPLTTLGAWALVLSVAKAVCAQSAVAARTRVDNTRFMVDLQRG